jgi:hypothetical protein
MNRFRRFLERLLGLDQAERSGGEKSAGEDNSVQATPDQFQAAGTRRSSLPPREDSPRSVTPHILASDVKHVSRPDDAGSVGHYPDLEEEGRASRLDVVEQMKRARAGREPLPFRFDEDDEETDEDE